MCEVCTKGKTPSFGKKLFEHFVKTESNLVMSPFSVQMVLTMAFLGSAGETAEQFQKVLGIKDEVTTSHICNHFLTSMEKIKSVTFSINNKIYVKSGFEISECYLKKIKKVFYSDVEEIDFEDSGSAGRINSWVEKQTNGKINNLVKSDDFDGQTRLFLANAVYFKGNWKSKFDPKSTAKNSFFSSTGEREVDMMFRNGDYNYTRDDNLKSTVLEIPYEGEEFNMVIILPYEIDGIEHVKNNILSFNNKDLKMKKNTVLVGLPKFRIESDVKLEEVLKKLGLVNMFNDSADFSGISKRGLVVDKVVQKAFIEVNEEGTEAAAATGMKTMLRSLPPMIICDHEFMFLIKYEDLVLFVGIYS